MWVWVCDWPNNFFLNNILHVLGITRFIKFVLFVRLRCQGFPKVITEIMVDWVVGYPFIHIH